MIGKLFGKVVGEIVAAPWTIGKEIWDAAEEVPKQAEKAVERATEEKDDNK